MQENEPAGKRVAIKWIPARNFFLLFVDPYKERQPPSALRAYSQHRQQSSARKSSTRREDDLSCYSSFFSNERVIAACKKPVCRDATQSETDQDLLLMQYSKSGY